MTDTPRRLLRAIGGIGLSALQCVLFVLPAQALPLSPGDRIRVTILDGEEFNGTYEVNLDGNIDIPYLSPLKVVGKEPDAVRGELRQLLVNGGYFQPSFLQLSVNVIQWAPVNVFVAGDVFFPGRVLINEKPADRPDEPAVTISGQYPPNRFLSVALKSSGGVKPTADVSAIKLIRGGKESLHDFSGLFTGEPVQDVALIANDQVIVTATEKVNPQIIRPSPITLAGVKVFLSNLTVPATGNAPSGISRDATSFTYGNRFSQAVVAANCAGGTRLTNAGRKAILVRTDESTGKTNFVERKVDSLLMNSANDADNPYLMPNDAVACYDSATTTVRDIIRSIAEIVTPAALLINGFSK
ncbi:polysaccharide biosynthesis/export family protein [Cyanobium gracile]|uniref:Periplasmic protein involved in polysaccharide export n=1 Tax=Cyanobium gracile (strain ATCC 27147 / PCC 6307) TaxID=292564 RepID=K9P4A9_CYAGP|nr:polysaccharide biosynthesis/export family protein [Cyanobium gracile]AFY27561.1 periplasmic protein involved in polysaccharide export [Cyanobium gracile PCC 6307]